MKTKLYITIINVMIFFPFAEILKGQNVNRYIIKLLYMLLSVQNAIHCLKILKRCWIGIIIKPLSE